MATRILKERDAAAWWQLRLEALESEPFAFGKSAEEHRATPVETIAQRFRAPSPAHFTLGAFAGRELVGMATFVMHTGLKERHKGSIFGVYVTQSRRGKGVARAMMTKLLKEARKNPALEQIHLAVATGQTAARQLYCSFGFESYGTESNALKVGSVYIDEDHMILPI